MPPPEPTFEDNVAAVARVLLQLAQENARLRADLATKEANLLQLQDSLHSFAANLDRANSTLRTLVEIVDPSIWQDGQANMDELLNQVRRLRNQARANYVRYADTRDPRPIQDVELPPDEEDADEFAGQ